MKKSEICRVAQLTVLKDRELEDKDKLAIIQYLHDREDTELSLERIEEREKMNESLKNARPPVVTDSEIAEPEGEGIENAESGE